MKNSRFTVAIHVLSLLSFNDDMLPGEPMKSHQITASVNTNPIIIRRILGKLRQVGLVEIYSGATGGAILARAANNITLLDVYRAIEEDELFDLHPNTPAETCPVGSNIKPILIDIYKDVSQTIESRLSQTTIADLHQVMRAEFCRSKNITPEEFKMMWQQKIG